MNEQQQMQQQQLEALKKSVMKKILSKGAMERLSRVRLVKPELADNVELYLMQLFQTGKIKGEISEEQLKMILDAVTTKKEFKFLR